MIINSSDEEKKLLQEVYPIKINPFLEWLPNLLEHVKIQTGPSGELCDENSAQNRTPFDIYASPYQHSSISAYHLISASPTPSSSKISFTVTLVPGFSYLQKRILSMKVADCRRCRLQIVLVEYLHKTDPRCAKTMSGSSPHQSVALHGPRSQYHHHHNHHQNHLRNHNCHHWMWHYMDTGFILIHVMRAVLIPITINQTLPHCHHHLNHKHNHHRVHE